MSDSDATINDRMVVLRARLSTCVSELGQGFENTITVLKITGTIIAPMRKHSRKTQQVNAGWMQRYTQKVTRNKL